MSKLTGDTPDQIEEPEDDGRNIDKLLASSNWERRLAEARARREQVLAQKGMSDPQPMPKPPGFDPVEDDVPVQAAQPTAGQIPLVLHKTVDSAKSLALKVKSYGLGRSWAGPGLLSWLPSRPRSISSASGNVIVAMACCASLGFGLALGFGVMLGVGGLSQSEPTGVAYAGQPAPTDYAETVATETPEVPTSVAEKSEPPLTIAASVTPPKPVVSKLPAPLVEEAEVETAAPVVEDDTPISTTIEPPAPRPIVSAARLPYSDVIRPADSSLADRMTQSGTVPDAFRLYVYAPDSVTDSELLTQMALLDSTGFPVASAQRVSLRISSPHIRYYNGQDAAVARAIASDLGIEARDFTKQTTGSLGRIEVWLDGTTSNSRRPTTVRSTKARRTTSKPLNDLRRLRNHLVRKLR